MSICFSSSPSLLCFSLIVVFQFVILHSWINRLIDWLIDCYYIHGLRVNEIDFGHFICAANEWSYIIIIIIYLPRTHTTQHARRTNNTWQVREGAGKALIVVMEKIKYNKNIRRTNVKLTIPVRQKLCKVEEITEGDTFNCALKCSEWRKINSVTCYKCIS